MDPHPHRWHLWLAHHRPEHAQRCTRIAGTPVCRRCAVLYPVALASAALVLAADPPTAVLVAAMWLLPAPMALEWVAEHLRWARYSPRRQVALTALGAPALGVALAIHAVAPLSLVAVAPVLVWGGICSGVALWSLRRSAPPAPTEWLERHEADESARDAALQALLVRADEQRSATPAD